MKIKVAIVAVVLLIIYCVFLQMSDKDEESNSKNSASEKGQFSSNETDNSSANSSSEVGGDSLEGVSDGYVKPSNRRFIQTAENVRNDPDNWFESAKIIAEPDVSEEIATKSIHNLLDEYTVIVKDGGYPTGLNHEIVNALLGDNARKIALLSMSHPRINDQGELVDQWGTPYGFHFESRNDAAVRSAGEDLTMYTEDDIVSSREESQ